MADIRNFTLNFGPQHPAAHGVLRLVLELLQVLAIELILCGCLCPVFLVHHFYFLGGVAGHHDLVHKLLEVLCAASY